MCCVCDVNIMITCVCMFMCVESLCGFGVSEYLCVGMLVCVHTVSLSYRGGYVIL